jgi:hypothetical protein
MVQAGVRKILNDVIDGDSIINYYNIETVADMKPGVVVKRDTTDYDIEVCDADGAAIGILGYGACNGPDKPETRDTIYVVSAEAPVHSGGGFYARVRVSSQAYTKGDPLAPGAAGIVIPAVETHVNAPIGRAAETVTNAVTEMWAAIYI